MRKLVFFFLAGSVFASTWTLKPYVTTSQAEVWLQDLLVETLPTNILLHPVKSVYTARDVGVLLRKVGLRDFVIVGEKVNVYGGVVFTTPERWFKDARQRYQERMLVETALPERFEVVDERMTDEGIELVCRVYLPDRVEERCYAVSARRRDIPPSRVASQTSYRFERLGEREGFLVYEKGGLRIRVPVRVLPTQLDDILVENKSNQRVLRFKKGEIEGL